MTNQSDRRPVEGQKASNATLVRLQLGLLLLLVVIYNINLRQVSSNDTLGSRFVPISILREGNLTLDEFFSSRADSRGPDGHVNDHLFRRNGRLYDSHPPVGPLLATPVYALPTWIGLPADTRAVANLSSKLSASLMAALSALLVFATTRRWLDLTSQSSIRIALGATIVYALGTSVWSTASQAMWTHTPALLAHSLALWALLAGRWRWAGFATGLAVVARPAMAPAALIMGLCVLHLATRRTRAASGDDTADARWSPVGWWAAGVVLVGVGAAVYNLSLFQHPLGGEPFRSAYWVETLGAAHMFAGSLLEGIAGLTLSPSRGLLVFSPVVILAVFGGHAVWRWSLRSAQRREHEAVIVARYASLAALTSLLVYARYVVWWGGHGYGPRYLTDLMPFVALLIAPGLAVLTQLRARHAVRVGVLVLVLYSVAVQAVGAFCWPSRWTLDPTTPYRLRLWDWRQSQIIVCLQSGPRVDPMARRLFERLGRGL